ncbi:MAG: thrombospondin type 3 repeat-containing protein [Pseudomonadota bacterium]
MSRQVSVFMFAIAAFVSAEALAGPVNWGTHATGNTLNCISADCGGGGVSGGDSSFGPADDNVEGAPASHMSNTSLGTSNVFVDVIDGNGVAVPSISGSATSSSQGIGSATGISLIFYTYSGPTTTITVDSVFNVSFTGPASGEDSNIDGILGRVLLFQNEFAIQDINDFEEGARLFCIGECYVPDDSYVLEVDTAVNIVTGSMDITLEDGDSFYLQATLDMGAAGGGNVSTIDDFTYLFSDTTGLTSVPVTGGGTDSDGDGVDDSADNCTLEANADQRDTDADGYGNICDPDLNNDGVVNFLDVTAWVPFFNTATTGDADLDGDGIANFVDFSIIANFFLGPPGPSGVAP